MYICPECGVGEGETVNCGYCDGEGVLKCNCPLPEECETCFGDGVVWCEICNGSGMESCEFCGSGLA